MLNIKTAAEARREWKERAKEEVEKAINEAQERWETECHFYNNHIPTNIIRQLREMGYLVSDEGDFVSWA